MSLGGYKFAGRFCQKGSLTDVQWVTLIHKTRTKAFIQANDLANAGWVPQEDGNTSFETYGNILHNLGGDANWITIFANGTDYMAIVTLSKFCFGGGTTATDTPKVTNHRDYGRSDYKYFSPFASCYIVISSSTLTEESVLRGNSQLLPIGAPSSITSNASIENDTHTVELLTGSAVMGNSTHQISTFLASTSLYFGYAVKGKSFITITNRTPLIAIFSLDAYSSKVNPNDNDNFMYINLNGVSYGRTGNYDETSKPSTSGYLWGDSPIWFNIGSSYFPGYKSGVSQTNDECFYFYGRMCPVMAQFDGAAQQYPYGNITLWAPSLDTACLTKGAVKIDLFAYNCYMASSSYAIGKPVANGNFLAAFVVQNGGGANNSWMPSFFTSMNYSSHTTYHALYVGWDPSNPDITQASAWTEYTGA